MKYFFLAAAMLLAHAGQAQVRFSMGPEASFTAASVAYPLPEYTHLTYRPGFQAGVQGVLQVGHFAVQPSLRFAQKGYNCHYEVPQAIRDTEYRLNYLTLPLSFAYSLHTAGQGLQLLAGPYASLLVGGHYRDRYNYRSAGGGSSTTEGRIFPDNGNDFPRQP